MDSQEKKSIVFFLGITFYINLFREKNPVPYQESGTSGLEKELQDMEEEREFMARLQNVSKTLKYVL